MKFSTLFIFIFLFSSQLFAQKIIKNGVVDFEVSFANLNAETKIVEDVSFVPAKLSYTHYFSSNSFMLENISSDSTIRIRHHRSKNGQGSYFFNIPTDQNYKVDVLSENTYKGNKTIDRLDVKVIDGYNCHKVKYTVSENDYIELYITKNLKPGFNYYKEIFPELKGFPLEIIVRKNNRIYKYTANSIQILPEKYPLLPDLQQYKLVKEGKLKKKLLELMGA